jgi:nucleotide-binding universal stress UspA family protein
MVRSILLPTDGSVLSEKAIRYGVELARQAGARVVGLHVIPSFSDIAPSPLMVADSHEKYERDSRILADRYLSVVAKEAAHANVPCHCVTLTGMHPHDAIVDAAPKNGCDLIIMASHGRRGVAALVLGSETNKVLTHAQMPVLIVR